MVDEHFPVKVSVIIAIHHESARLSQSIEIRRVSMELSRGLHFREADTSRCLQGCAIDDNLLNGSVVLVEFRQGTNHLVHHSTVETLGLAGLYALTHFAHAFLNLDALSLSSGAASRAREKNRAVRVLIGGLAL
jgi:hypothetical protein